MGLVNREMVRLEVGKQNKTTLFHGRIPLFSNLSSKYICIFSFWERHYNTLKEKETHKYFNSSLT